MAFATHQVELEAGRRIRVALVIPKLDAGGPDRVFFDLLRTLDRRRFEVVLVVHEEGGRYFAQLPTDVEVSVAAPRSFSHRLHRRYPVAPMRRVLRTLRPDVVLSTLRSILPVRFASLGAPWRVIERPANHMTANMDELRSGGFRYWVAAGVMKLGSSIRVDAYVAQSRDLATEIVKRGVNVSRIHVIGNPVDAAWLMERTQGGVVEVSGSPSIVAVGRLVPQKGFDILVEAFASLRHSQPNAGLTIVGEGPQREYLTSRAQALNIHRYVRFAGASPNPWTYMLSASVLVSSSRYEGFPNVVLEALALGCVVVASDCPGGTKDMVRDGENGWLVTSEDPGALAAGIERALSQPLSVGASERQSRIAQEYGIGHITRRYEAVFQELVSKGARFNQ